MILTFRIAGPLILVTQVLATSSNTCALAGPGFPAPSHLSSSSLLSDATSQFEESLRNEVLSSQGKDTAWGVALFSSKENKTLYEHYYTPPIDIGVSKVDRNSIFRIGSVSKVFSVWSFLIEVGDERFNDPITKYVPELVNLGWEEVTLGQLASHAAGIPRDPTFNELGAALDSTQAAAFGFPTLEKSQVPTCGATGANRTCTRSELFSYLLQQHPPYPTAYSPSYSNVAYTLLGYAQEVITGTPVGTAITKNIMGVLGMSDSSFQDIPSSGGVIPGGDATESGWNEDLGLTSPAGSIYSSTSDMVKAGQAILQSTLMSPAQTRRWLKPLIQTGYLSTAVGAPWEIRYLTLSNERMTQLYTKQGDESSYHAALVLSPEHDLGWIVLTAGAPNAGATGVRETLMNSFGNLFLPVAEQQAKNEAISNFSGSFVDQATNSSVIVQAGSSNAPGMLVTSLISRGAQVVGPESPLIQLYGAGQYARLYPSNLRATSMSSNGSGTYVSRLGFRATYFNATQPGQVHDPCLSTWTAIGAPTYGQAALDDWVFHIGEDGQAKSLEVAGYFTHNPKIKFVGHAGLGRHGGALILSEEASAEQKARKIVIKYSYGSLSPDKQSNADDDLRNEYCWLKKLRGAEHIGQLIYMADCSLRIPGISNGESTYEDSLRKNREREEASGDEPQPTAAAPVRRCPTFALEYLPYGTIYDLHEMLYTSGQLWVPSRFLWRIWLCMVRQCIAMAFPPDIPDDQYVGQLIDFGRGKLELGESARRRLPNNIPEYASKKNLYGAAQVMMRLCSVHTQDGDVYLPRVDPVPYTYTDESGSHTILTRAPEILTTNAIVDPQLLNLLARIMAYSWPEKPSLKEVLDETEAAINKGPDHPGLLTENAELLGVIETDDILEKFSQHWLYDAPPL
ncbi:hypothetical protein GQX73_g677 [Xylaria multiplex]|uniref:Uncharacterized protein n=1 Tax=Xylaria multiplex TaxID=323545 RepID=A0A7C8J852_9PEZI|nr:hypothetical protein GQX73_g677 [Xylaria multiplex]